MWKKKNYKSSLKHSINFQYYSIAIIVWGLILISTIGTQAGRDRFSWWVSLFKQDHRSISSFPVNDATSLPVGQARVARFLANKHKVSIAVMSEIVGMSYLIGKSLAIDPHMVLAIAANESGFNPWAESPVGAVGLMQIMPNVHKSRLKELGGTSLALDFEVNLTLGTEIFKTFVSIYGDESSALRAYAGIPSGAESSYPQQVLRTRNLIKAAEQGHQLLD